MREILFRGKRAIDGKWAESCCPLGEMHSGTVTFDFVQDTVCQYTGLNDSTKWEQLSENEKEEFLSGWNAREDRRNKKEDWCGRMIFEGDIVKYRFGGDTAPVRFGVYKSCFDSRQTEHCGFYADWEVERNLRKDLGYWAHMESAEIIGNIFDNPELTGGRP